MAQELDRSSGELTSDHETDPSGIRRFDGDIIVSRPGAATGSGQRRRQEQSALAEAGPAATASVPEPGGEAKAVTQAILEEIDKHSELMANIEYLCDMIGPRLTGSPGLNKANHWTRDKFRQYGLSNAHRRAVDDRAGLDPRRGEGPGRRPGRAAHPPRIGRLGPLDQGPAARAGDPRQGRVRRRAQPLQGEAQGGLGPARRGLRPALSQEHPRPTWKARCAGGCATSPGSWSSASELKKFLVAEQVAGILRDSNKEHGLVNMTAAASNFTQAEVAKAFLTTESYGLIWRLLKRGPVEVEIELKNTFSTGEVEVYNTVAEIPGAEKPDEVVIIGGHIDSWDLGTGATDNGTGIMAVLEAARALKAVGVKPKRTIRFVLFSGEEEGLHGSRAYVKAHEKEMSKISGVLIHDTGTGRVKSIGLQGRYDLREVMEKVVEPFKEAVNLEELSMRNMMGTDHLSFLPHGVPAFAVVQDPAEYRKTHHTESDTFDKVYPDEINQGAKVLAAWAYNVAMLPDVLPRDPKPARPGMFDNPEFQPTPRPEAEVRGVQAEEQQRPGRRRGGPVSSRQWLRGSTRTGGRVAATDPPSLISRSNAP